MATSPELLAPAGSLKALRFAFAYGADAVYAGLPRYSLRARNNEFNLQNLATGINHAHSLNKKLYIVSNIYPHNSKVSTFIDDMKPIIELKPDALIMADPGLIMMIQEQWPDTEIHLSVQSNVVNYATVRFWHKMGISRIILSRELSLKEINMIAQECPDMELEVFVHGALCMAYSGRCMLSGYMNRRDANQGVCTNACRWKYQAQPASEDAWGNIEPHSCGGSSKMTQDPAITEKTILLSESMNPDKQMTMTEDEHGTYIMNSKDLRAIHLVEKLYKIGIKTFKIEGRTKSPFYVARTTQLYRQAIDDAVAGKPFNIDLMEALEGLANRGYTEGLYRRHVFDEYQNYEQGSPKSVTQQYVGEIINYQPESQLATVEVKNRFELGDTIEVMQPGGNKILTLDHLENKKGQSISVAPGSGHVVTMPLHLDTPYTGCGLLIKTLPQTHS